MKREGEVRGKRRKSVCDRKRGRERRRRKRETEFMTGHGSVFVVTLCIQSRGKAGFKQWTALDGADWNPGLVLNSSFLPRSLLFSSLSLSLSFTDIQGKFKSSSFNVGFFAFLSLSVSLSSHLHDNSHLFKLCSFFLLSPIWISITFP